MIHTIRLVEKKNGNYCWYMKVTEVVDLRVPRT